MYHFIPSIMKAVQFSSHGGIEVLKLNDIPMPNLSNNQVLVKNHYAGVNFYDTYFRSGRYPTPHLPFTPGLEGAGEVVAVDDSVTDIKPGAHAAYICTTEGSYSEYTAIARDMVYVLPEGVSTQMGAAAMIQGLTAWTIIKESATVKAGQWVMVNAAAGGVGLLLCQMLRNLGAKVIGTASTEAKLELAKKNGAGWTVNSEDEGLVEKVKEITDGHGVDVILDGVGKATFQDALKMVAKKGQLVCYGSAVSLISRVLSSQSSEKFPRL